LVPDQRHKEAFEKIAPFLKKGRTLLVAHAFSIHFGEVKPNAETDVVMIAPKAPGHRMREVFKEGKGVPALIAVYQDATGQAEKTALAYAQGVGATRAGVIKTTFAEEVETDWFGEQVILCGGISELMKASFETLVEAGYQPEVAYFECVNEMKLIVDLIYEGGLSYMRYSVSDTAEYGDYTVGPRIINAAVRQEMKNVLRDIKDGTHAKVLGARALSGLGADVLEAGFPAASVGEAEAVARIAREVRGPTMAALARASASDVEAAAKALSGALRSRIHVFIATSDRHLE